MRNISLDTPIKEILKSDILLKTMNSVSNNLFDNPMLVQAETMSLKRVSALMGENGESLLQSIIDKANAILSTLSDEEEIDKAFLEIQNSLGLEATISEEERVSNIANLTSIKPGKVWYDTEGNRIQAHGASIYIENETYYWIGENKDHTTKGGEIWTWGIKIYSSNDLYNWKDEGFLIEPELEDKESIFYPVRRLDRPHLLFNENTKKYVLWLKYMDEAHYSVLTADSLMGEYTLVKEVYRPFTTDCGDFDLAKDTKTNQAYLYWEVNHTDLWGVKLSEDYTEVEGDYSVIYGNIKTPLTREAPAHMMRNGKHYIFTSGMTGYVPNPSEVAISDDWLIGYKVLGNPHVNDDSKSSFNSQISHIFKVIGEDKYIAIADRWVPDFEVTGEKYDKIFRAIASREDKTIKASEEDMKFLATAPLIANSNTSLANYVWLPIEFEDDKPFIRWYDEWTI